ncbi:Sas10/Utp3 family protein [Cryptosporidium muris RN66]|uniref:Sas10/Utp3 family protein n=1 Tax=Cryptosporidium muris (strain RN66) TaxID=441375 RepID=B6AI76_CRYMR|nr:Sas10/Utp3 family protein [Cryptosporidium muris RN66]EEA07917.1 Sas10/Utp3 family protein [Cryptosporidium muris RN66]|eukprot:XP_002142266.1 Sas10/Utp3 family protein [Cryptosporidium muris RN66]
MANHPKGNIKKRSSRANLFNKVYSDDDADDTLKINEVSVLSISDTTDDSENDHFNENFNENSDGELISANWGTKKEDFYDNKTSSENSDNEDWSDIEMQEEEARKIQKTRYSRLDKLDFGIEDIINHDQDENKDEALQSNPLGLSVNDVNDLLNSFGQLSKGSNKELINCNEQIDKHTMDDLVKLNPDIIPILKDMKEKIKDVKEKVDQLQMRIHIEKSIENNQERLLTDKGISYLECKNILLISYIGYLCYYMMLKLNPNISIKDHPVLLRLITLRTMMDKLRPIDVKLQTYIDRVTQTANRSGKIDELMITPRPDRLVLDDDENDNFKAESVGQYEEESEDRCDIDEDRKYKAPKNIPVEFNEKKLSSTEKIMKELEKEKQRLLRTDIIRQIRSSIQEGPELIGKEDDIEQLPQLAKLQRRIQKRLEFEEQNMMRLPKGKKDKKEEKLFKELISQVESGVNSLDDLLQFAEKTTNMATNVDNHALSRYISHSQKLEEDIKKATFDHFNCDRSISDKIARRNKAINERRHREKYETDHTLSNNEDNDPVQLSDNEYLEEINEYKQEKQHSKAKRKQEFDEVRMPNIEDLVEGDSRRLATEDIIKNKGLTRKRKKIEGNSRVHNRIKYKKALKKLKGIKRDIRPFENDYSGELTGLKSNIKRSMKLS